MKIKQNHKKFFNILNILFLLMCLSNQINDINISTNLKRYNNQNHINIITQDQRLIQSISASSYQDPNQPSNTIDQDFNTRWSAEGDGQWIQFDLGSIYSVNKVLIAWYSGSSRSSQFDLEYSLDGNQWLNIFSGSSSGTTLDFEVFIITSTNCRFLRYIGHGNSQNLWNSITEIEIHDDNDIIAPTPPKDLILSQIGPNSIKLSWAENIEPDLASYKIFRSMTTNFELTSSTFIGETSDISFIDKGLCNEVNYYYKLTAIDTNYLESLSSSEKSIILSRIPLDLPSGIIHHVDFNNWNDGLYDDSKLDQDWNNPSWSNGIQEGRVSLIGEIDPYEGKSLQIEYPTGGVGPSQGGAQWQYETDISYDDLYCSYYLRFCNDFDFVLGGKIPGLAGGERNTGGDTPDGTDGWSARMMWRTDGQIVQYIYHPDQAGVYGDDVPWQINNQNQYFQSEAWYLVEHRVKMNTPGQNDGILQTWLNGEKTIDMQSMRWRDVDSFSIDCFYFSTFFGGSGTEWAPIKTEYIDFDEFIISTTPITHEISNFGPIITQFPDNVQYIEGQLENTINWSATDSDPDKYNIYQDDLIIYTGSWLLDVPIIISVDGLNVGNYSYKIEFFDSEGHSTIDEVIVSIIPNTGIPDVNNDGNVNIVDALLISQYYVGESLENFDPTYADCDKNGQINIVDALMIAQYYVGTRPQWW